VGTVVDRWSQAFRHDEVKFGREELDARRRAIIVEAITSARASAKLDGDVDAPLFALEFGALLDGLSVQVALDDPECNSQVAYDIAMRFCERELKLPPSTKNQTKASTPR
jgi:BetI-type transcriptional repressor, C-terminal